MTVKEFAKLIIDTIEDESKYGDAYTLDSIMSLCEKQLDKDTDRKLYEKLEEIQAICIGADSPDAHEHAERDPIEELQCCQQDIGAISNIVEEIQQMIGE